jgi:hypothetical protein
MAQVKYGFIAGIPYCQIFKVRDCYAYGQVADVESVSTPSTSGAYLIKDVQSAPIAQITRSAVSQTGGGRVLGTVQFGPTEIPEFTVDTGGTDADLFALVTGSSVDQTTNTLWSTFSENASRTSLPQCGMMFSSNFQTIDEDCDGEQKWLNVYVPRCKIAPSFPALLEAGVAPTQYQVTPAFTNKEINGDAFGTDIGLDDDKAWIYATVTDNPLAIVTWFADGVAITFNTVYRPINTTITVNASPNHFAVNGTPTALTSIVVATGLATAAAAGSDGDINVLIHETVKFQAVT